MCGLRNRKADTNLFPGSSAYTEPLARCLRRAYRLAGLAARDLPGILVSP
jgi:hypothetical protein